LPVMLLNVVIYLLIVVIVADGSEVVTLTDKNFDTILAEKQLVLVNFFTARYVTAHSS